MSDNDNNSSQQPLESIFAALEEIVGQLEEGERPLEDALALFAQGIQLCREGTKRLDATEAAIEELLQDADGNDVVLPLRGASRESGKSQ